MPYSSLVCSLSKIFWTIERTVVSPNMSSFEIRAVAQECRKQFELLIGISADIGSINEAADDFYDVSWIEDQFARFKMWAGNIGAFADGHASLDYRLRDTEKTQQFMLDFLIALTDYIHRGKCVLSPSFH